MASPSPSVPVATSLADIYSQDDVHVQARRWEHLLARFRERHGQAPDFVARSPGRVNIIGEHIDYSLYSVLPMAITADALIAVAASDPKQSPGQDKETFGVEVANVEEDRFPTRTFTVPLDGDVDIDASVHEWTNYFKSGLRGALQLLRRKQNGLVPKSLKVLVHGTVPAGGGLSSSAAFVSASALAVLVANGVRGVDKKELTELAIVSERAVGVNSGGMDQSASVFSTRDAALFVSFSPALTARPVHFPPTNPPLAFLVAQSFVAADKHVTGPIHYNLRVVECTLAAAYLNAVLNPPGTTLPADASPLGISLHGFHETFFYHRAAATDRGGSEYSAAKSSSAADELDELLRVARDKLTQEQGYTREEIAAVLGKSVPELEERFMSRFPVRADRFLLRQRALHVFSEARRVLAFMDLLEHPPSLASSDDHDDTAAYNHQLGDLLNQTQDSCRDAYECSCAEIDELCRLARGAGAYGSRLTGAGWGGCTVHLVPQDRVADVRRAWEEGYYKGRNLSEEQRGAAVVESRPGSGSAVFFVDPAREGPLA